MAFVLTACESQSPVAPPADVNAQTPESSVVLSAAGGYSAKVRRTSHGIPHVVANDYASLGYGHGYAFAQDNLCALAEVIVTVNGHRSRYFGPDGGYNSTIAGPVNNLKSDFFYQSIKDAGTVEELLARPPPLGPSQQARELVRGYAAGFNRYLRDVGVNGLPDPQCRGAAWVRPLTEMDIFRRNHAVSMLASSAFFLNQIVDARPPTLLPDDTWPQPLAVPESLAPGVFDPNAFPNSETMRIGSNAVGLGRQATHNGRGMVLGNPHFPWTGPERFYQVHLTIPGELNVSGVSLLGLPMVLIGHNDRLAWSHTVSTAFRFTPIELTLVTGSPTHYLYNGWPRMMTSRTVTVQARRADGTLEPRSHTFYRTHLGPMIEYPQGLMTWNGVTGYAIRDANATNMRTIDQFLAMGKAQSVEELRRAQTTWQGVPWVNTVAADDQGNTYYADSSVVPHVTQEQVARCVLSPTAQLVYHSRGLPVLDGSRSECEWGSDADAVEPGILGPSRLPRLIRQDYVTNSNDSYWLANPAQPLTGFPRIIGAEGTARSLRTRLGLHMVQQRLAGTDGMAGKGFTLEQLQTMVFNNRNHSGELLRDQAVAMCQLSPFILLTDGRLVDVREACDVLANWDLRGDLNSSGALLWREFMRRAQAVTGGPYLVPFNPSDPVNTPNTLDTLHPEVIQALGAAVQEIRDRNQALNISLGAVQYAQRNESRIPIHGCLHFEGCFNVINNKLEADFTYSTSFGSSFVMAVNFTDNGPKARSVLTYSQSTDSTSPYFADQTWMYSRKEWVDMRFTEAEITSDPAYSLKVLQE
jgi:acyl-homoserine-lactone acylase